MVTLKFPRPMRHDRHEVKNVNALFEERLTFGQRAADSIARAVGSWHFILIQSALLLVWGSLNVVAWAYHWDPYPFILMNLLLSLQAAYTAPMIMMSQNRQEMKDRLAAHNDYVINAKAEEEIRVVLEHLEAQGDALLLIHEELETIRQRISGNEGEKQTR